jgi:urea transport system permease protein
MGGTGFCSRVWSIFCLGALAACFPPRAIAEGKPPEPSRPPAVQPASAAAAPAADEAIRRALQQLAEKKDAVRQKALHALVQTHDLRLMDVLKFYHDGSLYLWKKQVVYGKDAPRDATGKRIAYFDPLTREPVLQDGKPVMVPEDDAESVDVSRSQREAANNAMQALELFSTDFEQRFSAVRGAGDRREDELVPALVEELLPALEEIVQSDPSERIRRAARESIALVRLKGTFPDGVSVDRVEAARELGVLHSARGRNAMVEQLKQMDKDAEAGKPVNEAAREVYQQSIRQIDRYQTWVGVFDCVKNGLSSGSILVLMALGLAITFGTMGVINMAHGELMMVGAFTTYSMELLFVKCLPERLFNWYYLAALPASFLVAGLCGFLIEWLVVRHLYGRPLETLLATFGVSWILIKGVQKIFGESIGVHAPTWLVGSVELMQDMSVPYSRAFVILLCVFCVLLFYCIMNFTKLGLRMRATAQNREMAAALGVNTRWVDGCTFALGSGLAGIAGCGITLIGGVSPGMGQTYIVESFLVVVTGGVGELAGTLYAGMGLGVLNKIMEPWLGAVWAQVLVLVAVVLFIQRRPAGLFPPKGRHADV